MILVLKEECKKLSRRLLDGEVTVKKTDVWIAAGICTMLGVLIGLLSAPLTHGITICCGNNNGNSYREDEDCCCEED